MSDLPWRRPQQTEEMEYNGQRLHLSIGFIPDGGQPREVFLKGFKCGSEMDALIDDAMICLSKAMQCGMSPKHLTKTLGGDTLVGKVVQRLADVWP